jgi:hypothetical protein
MKKPDKPTSLRKRANKPEVGGAGSSTHTPRDENGTDTAGYRVIPYHTLMYLSRIRDRIRVLQIRDGYRTGPGNNTGG